MIKMLMTEIREFVTRGVTGGTKSAIAKQATIVATTLLTSSLPVAIVTTVSMGMMMT
jgi:hypothetical protein